MKQQTKFKLMEMKIIQTLEIKKGTPFRYTNLSKTYPDIKHKPMNYINLPFNRKMKALQYPPTGLSQPHKQLGTFRNPFERGVICNNIPSYTRNLSLSVTPILTVNYRYFNGRLR